MVNAFSARLDSKLANFSLPPGTLQEIQAGEIKLAGLQLPTSLNETSGTAIRESVREAFVFGFRLVMLICAGLSVASAASAWRLIPGDRGTLPTLPSNSGSRKLEHRDTGDLLSDNGSRHSSASVRRQIPPT